MRLFAVVALLTALPAAAAPAASRRFHLAHQFTVPAKATAWIPLPSDDPWQRVTALSVEGAPFTVVHDPRWGNAFARVEAPAGGATVELAYDVTRDERGAELAGASGRAAPSGYRAWLEADTLVPLNERIRKIAADVTAKARTPLDKARAAYAYVLSTMKYDKPEGDQQGWGRGDILWACDRKYGNCTDFHALFIGILRASGVPARFAIGYSVPGDGDGGVLPGYHCWADFYLDGAGWVPVDASEAWKHPERRDYFFGHHDANRVQLSTGRDVPLPAMRATPVNYIVYPYAELDGKPVAVGRTTRWSPLK
jgi:transglutaminase-like putative cysteine protease